MSRLQSAPTSRLVALAVILFFGGALTACGDAGTHRRSSSVAHTASAQTVTKTTPSNPAKTTTITDLRRVLKFGRPATPAQGRNISAVVKRYYAAASAGDGARACSLLYLTLSESVAEDYGAAPAGPPELRGSTCAEVMSKLFRHRHRQPTPNVSAIVVTGVRISGRRAFALLSSLGAHGTIGLYREAGGWRIGELIGHSAGK